MGIVVPETFREYTLLGLSSFIASIRFHSDLPLNQVILYIHWTFLSHQHPTQYASHIPPRATCRECHIRCRISPSLALATGPGRGSPAAAATTGAGRSSWLELGVGSGWGGGKRPVGENPLLSDEIFSHTTKIDLNIFSFHSLAMLFASFVTYKCSFRYAGRAHPQEEAWVRVEARTVPVGVGRGETEHKMLMM